MSFASFTGKIKDFCTSPGKVFAAAVGIAIFSSLCYILFFGDIHRDTAYVYAYFAREIGNGNFYDGIVEKVPMLNISLGGLLAWCGMDAVKALALVAGFFYVAACFPLRRFLERYLSPLAAAWGCLLYAAAPKLIRFSCVPLLESSRIFFIISAVLFFFRTIENPKIKNALLFGASAGLLAVSRGEALLATIALLAGYPLYLLIFRRPERWKPHFAMWACAIGTAFIISSPFWVMNYVKAGYFVPDMRVVQYYTAIKTTLSQSADSNSTVPFGQSLMTPEEGNGSWSEKAHTTFTGLLRGGYELYWLLAAIGAAVLFRKKQLNADYLVLLGISILQILTYFIIVSSYRYYLFLIPLFMMFTITGVQSILEFARRRLPEKFHAVAALPLALILVVQVADGVKKAFSQKEKYYREVGEWIETYRQTHFPERRLRIFAPSIAEVAYWSGAKHTDEYGKLQHDPATFCDFDLAAVHSADPKGLEKRADLELITAAPHNRKVWVFRKKSTGGAK